MSILFNSNFSYSLEDNQAIFSIMLLYRKVTVFFKQRQCLDENIKTKGEQSKFHLVPNQNKIMKNK